MFKVRTNAVWKSPYNASFEGSVKSVTVVVRSLHSATTYDYRFAAEYVDSYRYANLHYSYNETFLQVSQQFRTKRKRFLTFSVTKHLQENGNFFVHPKHWVFQLELL